MADGGFPSYTEAERSFWGRAGVVVHHFSPADPQESGAADPAKPVGPGSNTGQKSQIAAALHRAGVPSTLSVPIIDWCTVVLSSPQARAWAKQRHPAQIVRELLGTDAIACSRIEDRSFNHCPRSCFMVDGTSKLCGRIGLKDDGTVVVSLSGQGCGHVPRWPAVADKLDEVGAHITRVDIAVDDLSGQTFSVQDFRERYEAGDFTMHGRPPKARTVGDLGNDTGCSVYIGKKGHKELCVYEKGKQLGDPESPYVRCELRLYAKRIELPNDVLRNPHDYFAAAYPVLAEFVLGELERLDIKRHMVETTLDRALEIARTQGGAAVNAVLELIGDENALALVDHFRRRGCRPGRLKVYTEGDLELARQGLLLKFKTNRSPNDESDHP